MTTTQFELLPKAQSNSIFFALVQASTNTTFQDNPTLASGDFKISKDGGALANTTNLPSSVDTNTPLLQLTLTSTELNADQVTIICEDASGAEWRQHVIAIRLHDLTRTVTPANKLAVDASGRIDVGSWLGSAVTKSSGNLPDVNVAEISDDSAAADTLETYLDGGDYMPVDVVQISGSSTGADNLELYTTGADNMQVHVVELASGFDFSSTMKTSLETAVANVMDDAIPSSPTSGSINQRIKAIDELTEASGTGDLAAMKSAITTTNGVYLNMAQTYPESPATNTIGYVFYLEKASHANKIARSGTTVTLYKDDGTSTLVSRSLDAASNPSQISP